MTYVLQIQRLYTENLDAHMEALKTALRGAGATLSDLEEEDGFWTLKIKATGIALKIIVQLEQLERDLPEDIDSPFSWTLQSLGGIERDALELMRIDGRPGIVLSNRRLLTEEEASRPAGDKSDAADTDGSADIDWPLVLGSGSPRRRALLELMGFEFAVQSADIDEADVQRRTRSENGHLPLVVQAALACRATAEAKALAVLQQLHEDHPVIVAADTIVYDRGRLLGKPRSEEDAHKMLRSLSGHGHQVITAVSIVDRYELSSFVDMTRVHFNPWDDNQQALAQYSISSGSAMDKAGAYGIQEEGGLLVSGIEGDFYTVMGLPVGPLWRELRMRGMVPDSK